MTVFTVNITNSQIDGVTAFVGGGQSSATVLDHTCNIIDTCATVNDSCKLDTGTVGNIREVFNYGAQDMALFPAVGEELFNGVSGLGVNNSITISAGGGFKFRCFSTGAYRFD